LRTVAIAAFGRNVRGAVPVADGVVLLVGSPGGVADDGVDVPLDPLGDAAGAALGADAPEHAVTAASEIATSTVPLPVRMATASVARRPAAMRGRRLAARCVRV
jgi:hypothetical protein